MDTEDGRLSKEAEMVFKSVRQHFASWYNTACLSLDYAYVTITRMQRGTHNFEPPRVHVCVCHAHAGNITPFCRLIVDRSEQTADQTASSQGLR